VQPRQYFLVTAHRAENVDHESRLRSLLGALAALHDRFRFPVVCSLHPRTKARLESFGLGATDGIRFAPPFGFCDFVRLEQSAFCVLSDSGTVQEETCILRVPNVIIRDVSERPETVECGSTILAGVSAESVVAAVTTVTTRPAEWTPPREYLQANVADTVCRIVLGDRPPDAAELEWRQGVRL
jgi:UDP-N-acetylglucosamine 2-epimerase (non-hydrolysing)